jgi:hypothetical protein
MCREWTVTFGGYSTPRAALGLIGIAMAALTMCALVVLPARLEAASSEVTVATTAATAANAGAALAGKAHDEGFDARVSGGSNCNSTKDRS